MESSENKSGASGNNKDQSAKSRLSRRTLLKGLAGLPVLGVLGWKSFEKYNYSNNKKSLVLKELGLDKIEAPVVVNSPSGSKKDLLRIGVVGFGSRANQLSNALGYMHPDDAERRAQNETLEGWLGQEDLNVALTGICEVFDMRAQRGIETGQHGVRSGGAEKSGLPVTRYLNYHDMLADKNIDAVIIATPDHHHAQMAIDAVKAGKHVYCEKGPATREEDLFNLYSTVKNSDVVYQIGHQITQNVIYQQAREIINKDILGKITLVETSSNRNSAHGAWIRHLDGNGNPKPGDENSIDWRQWLGSAPYVPFSTERYYNWTLWFDYNLGLINQLFTHEYDAVNQLLRMGQPKSVVSSGGIYYWKDGRDMPDVLHIVIEYPERDLTLTYSGNLANSRGRGRVFMGHDASMELGSSISITADRNSTRYRDNIRNGIIDPAVPMLSIQPGSGEIDAVTSATERYYASRGLTTTNINGRQVDVTHLHVKQWIDCIRNGNEPSGNIERAFEEGLACIMAHKSYVEKRRVEWDPVNQKIV